jgi:TP901 family phage tail tape measure protein
MSMSVAELVVRVVGDTADATRKLAQLNNEVQSGATKAEQAAKRSQAAMDQLGRAAQVGGAAVLGALGLATKSAAEYDQALRNVTSLSGSSEAQFKKLSASVMALAADPQIRQGPKDLATALYDVVSSGFEGEKAMEVLKVAAMGASAGMTDTKTAAGGLMAVLNSGIGGVTSAKQGMDVLFQIVNRGVVNFKELSGSIGAVLPIAAKAGISLQEIGAGIAVSTKQGQSGAEAINDIQNLITKIIRPSDEAAKRMRALGISFGLPALQAKGLSGVLAEITQKTQGNQQVLARLFPDMQAFRGLLALTANGGKNYVQELEAMRHASDGVGATQKALTEQNKGAMAQWQLLRKELEILGIKAGQVLLPTLRQIVQALTGFARTFQQLSPGMQSFSVKFAAIAASVAVVLRPIMSLVQALGALRGAFTGVGTAGAAGMSRFLGPLGTIGGMLAAGKAGNAAGDFLGDKMGLPKANGAMARPMPGFLNWMPDWMVPGGMYKMPKNPTPLLSGRPRGGPGFDALRVAPAVDIAHLTEQAKAKLQALDDALASMGIRAGTITSGKRSSSTIHSAHNSGQAVDIVTGGNMAQIAQQLQAMGFRAGFETKGQHNANGSVATGNHIHVTLGSGHIAGAKDAPSGVHPFKTGGAPIFGFDPDDDKVGRKKAKTPAQREAERFRDMMAGTNASIRDLKAGGDKSGFEKLKADFPLTDPAQLKTLFNAQQTRDALSGQRAAAKRAQEEQIRDTIRLKEALADSRAELTAASGKTDAYAQTMARLNLTTKTLTPEMKKLVGEIVKVGQQTERVHAFRQQMADLAQGTKNVFGQAFMSMNQGFKGFFGSIIAGFSNMLRQMAAEYLASALVRSLFGAAGGGGGKGSGLIGAFVGGLFGGGRAGGGSVSGGKSYLVGEDGPELVTMGGNGHVTPNRQLRAMGGHTFVFNVQTPNPEAFRHSMGQMFQDAHRHTTRMARRNG